jgi:hypothetical protein
LQRAAGDRIAFAALKASSAGILPAVPRASPPSARRARTPTGQPPGRRRYSDIRLGIRSVLASPEVTILDMKGRDIIKVCCDS